MVLIAESGSTKCDWLLYSLEGEDLKSFKSMGFNPYFHDAELVQNKLSSTEEVVEIQEQVSHVFFFGAGCSSPELNARIEEGLSGVFTSAHIEVDHDLSAAAYATYNGSPGISCIIGTGSNSCYFDGQSIRKEVPSLAYILGDEASGSFFGKKLLAAYFYRQLSAEMENAFREEYPWMDKDQLVERVYRSNAANVFLASFMPFVVRFKGDPLVSDWVKEGFHLFLKNQVVCYPEHREVPIHFVGSIAHYLREELQESLQAKGMSLGNIVQKPARRLANYVFEHLIETT